MNNLGIVDQRELIRTGHGVLIDTEYNALMSNQATKVWCAVTLDLKTGEKRRWHPEGEGVNECHDQFASALRFYLKDFDYYVGHNYWGAEYYVLRNLVGFHTPQEKIIDTLVMSRTLRQQSPKSEFFKTFREKGWDTRVGGHGLAAWGKRLGLAKIDFDDFEQFTFEQLDYCEGDVDLNLLVFNQLVKEWDAFDFSPDAMWIEHESHRLLQEQTVNGFLLNPLRCRDLFNETTRLMEEYKAELHKVFPEVRKLLEVYSPKIKKDGTMGAAQKKKLLRHIHEDNGDGTYNLYEMVIFNPGSPKQVGERLMSLGWNPRKYTATGQPSTDKATIQEAIDFLSKKTPEVEVLRKYGVVKHRCSMSKEWLALAEAQKDGRIRGTCFHIGTWTHRSSHYNPNMGNVASVVANKSGVLKGLEGNFGWDSRHCWVVPEGKVLVGADASGIQLRALAHYMGDLDYINEILEGDIHIANMVAAGISTRDIAKTFIYAWLLGAGDEKIGQIVGFDDSEKEGIFTAAKKEGRYNFFRGQKTNLLWYVCDKLRDEERAADEDTAAVILKGFFTKKKFLDALPALRRFKEDEIKTAAKQGFMVGIDGRKIWVPSEHLAMGAYLQGFEATIMKWAMIIYQQKLNSLGVSFKQVDYVHDEFQVETDPENADLVGKVIVEAIKEAGTLLGSKCPLDGEYKVGKSWAETH